VTDGGPTAAPGSAAGAVAARDAFRDRIEAKGHATDNVRAAVVDLDAAIARGDIARTPIIDEMLADLGNALEQDDGQKLGGKSAEAARFIAGALLRQLDAQADAG
jgi:hypothetical protein